MVPNVGNQIIGYVLEHVHWFPWDVVGNISLVPMVSLASSGGYEFVRWEMNVAAFPWDLLRNMYSKEMEIRQRL